MMSDSAASLPPVGHGLSRNALAIPAAFGSRLSRVSTARRLVIEPPDTL